MPWCVRVCQRTARPSPKRATSNRVFVIRADKEGGSQRVLRLRMHRTTTSSAHRRKHGLYTGLPLTPSTADGGHQWVRCEGGFRERKGSRCWIGRMVRSFVVWSELGLWSTIPSIVAAFSPTYAIWGRALYNGFCNGARPAPITSTQQWHTQAGGGRLG